MSEQQKTGIDKAKARQAFERSAAGYDQAAVLQREIGDRMLQRLDVVRLAPFRILDVGAGTGYCMQALAQRYSKSRIFAVDVAASMLLQARSKLSWRQRLWRQHAFITGDAEQLPIADASMDMIFSNLALQWCPDLDQVFSEFRRVLKPGGLLMFSTFGPDTLKELRACWNQVDEYSHINSFVDMHDIGDSLLRSGFADPVMDMEMLTVTYPDAYSVMRDLKQIGAHNVTHHRARGLTGKQRLQAVVDAYEAYRAEGSLPVTHEVVYGHAWISDTQDARFSRDSSVSVPINRIGITGTD